MDIPPDHAGEPEDEVLVAKRGSTSSAIWNYFGFKRTDVGQEKVHCRKCRAVVCTKTGNTTNLISHLKHNHVDIYHKFNEERTPRASSTKSEAKKDLTKQASIESLLPYDKKSKRHIENTDAVTYYLAKDMVPFYSVGKEGFQNLMKKMDRRYKIPSRNYFSDTAIPELYDKCKKSVLSEIEKVRSFSTTTDLWSSRAREPYSSLTLHYITDSFALKSLCLETSYMPQDHTAENIAQGLKDSFAAWNLDEQNLVSITTDNASSMVLAAQLNNWTRLQCFGHRLHLAIGNLLL